MPTLMLLARAERCAVLQAFPTQSYATSERHTAATRVCGVRFYIIRESVCRVFMRWLFRDDDI